MPNVVKKVRDLLSFLGGLGIVYHETVIVAAEVGPRIDLLVVATLLLGVAPATITNRWLGGTTETTTNIETVTNNQPNEQENNAPRS